MINLSLFAFLAILEGIVVLLIVIGVLVWRLRARRAKDRIAYIDGSDAHPTPALYLESEVAKTRTYLESLTAENADAGAAQSALSLRAALLEVEAELSQSARGTYPGILAGTCGTLGRDPRNSRFQRGRSQGVRRASASGWQCRGCERCGYRRAAVQDYRLLA